MSIDGISGPKGPGAPKGIEAVRPTEAAEAATATDAASGVAPGTEGPEGVEVVEAPGTTDVVNAVDAVSEDLRVGAVADVDEAVDVALEQIVESRYGAMAPGDREAFTQHLRDLARTDPVFGQQLRLLVESAAST